MSQAGLEAVRLAVEEVKAVISSLTDDEWAMQSGCEAWTVKELVAHMSSNYKEICEPSPPPAEPISLPAERLMDMLVEPRKEWSNAEVRDEYLAYCDGAVRSTTIAICALTCCSRMARSPATFRQQTRPDLARRLAGC
jgi:Mycothiol maleylpyruvate isomerase N-terminal domain